MSPSELYKYYSDIESYPKRYPRYCKSVTILGRDGKSLTTKEHWRFTYVQKKDGAEKTADVELVVRYRFKEPPKSIELLPTRHEAHQKEKAYIYFEILEGNPGSVNPDFGMVRFWRDENKPDLVHADVDCTGDMAFHHLSYIKHVDEIWVKMDSIVERNPQGFKIGDYIYEQDVLNLEGQEKRLDEPRIYRGRVKIRNLDDCFITRVTDKYPFKNPQDRYTIQLISQGRRLHNYMTLNKDRAKLVLQELERGLKDFEQGRIERRNEMKRTNDFVWLGYDEETRNSGAAAYLVFYFGEDTPNIMIEFSSLDEVKMLTKELRAAYDAW